jgi:hypothetical protein
MPCFWIAMIPDEGSIYGNALLYNIRGSLTSRLQRVENCAAGLLTRTGKREHITPVLFNLHWLLVRFRSMYKILFHTFKVFNGTAPVYLSDLIEKYITVRMLRSESFSLLRVPRSHTAVYGEKSSEHQLPGCSTSCQITLNSQQVETYFVRFLKHICLNWRIYDFKPVYYVWNVFDLYMSSEYVLITF